VVVEQISTNADVPHIRGNGSADSVTSSHISSPVTIALLSGRTRADASEECAIDGAEIAVRTFSIEN
jgi:hypothetical protein